jgi:hypothetical protein
VLPVTAAALLLAAVAAGALPPIAFRFEGRPGEDEREGTAAELRVDGDSRADLFLDSGKAFPRWAWIDGAVTHGGAVTFRARVGSRVLLVLRKGHGRGYELDGPFAWPPPVSRVVRALPRRTIFGARLPSGRNVELRLVGPDAADAMCETSGSAWQCPAVPRSFAGRIVACDGGRALAAGDVRPDLPDSVEMHGLSHIGLLRAEPVEHGAEVVGLSARILRQLTAGGAILVRDRSWDAKDLGGNLLWIEGSSDPAAILVEARADGFATTRMPFSELTSPCGEPVSVALTRSHPLEGDVTDAAGRTVAGALVLVRSVEAPHSPAPLAETATGEDGSFALNGLEMRRYRLRVCHAEAGCAETTSVPGERAAIVLSAEASFFGRVLTGGGVPEPGALVRIVPGIETWTRASDRLAPLPLETTSADGGRFSIVAPDAGDFLLEVRGVAGGLARLAVRRSPLSPRVTDLGDVRLSEPLDLTVRVARCSGGALSMSGPLGGETSLPSVVSAPLDAAGAASVRLPEGGAWAAWASCGGSNVTLDPGLLPDVAILAGIELRFEPAGPLGAAQSTERSK